MLFYSWLMLKIYYGYVLFCLLRTEDIYVDGDFYLNLDGE
jgi:hypothetical protein